VSFPALYKGGFRGSPKNKLTIPVKFAVAIKYFKLTIPIVFQQLKPSGTRFLLDEVLTIVFTGVVSESEEQYTYVNYASKNAEQKTHQVETP
jgi:hypothetical protein